ncbi:MAG: sulfotransferase [Clostridia bacterium]|nr:sulfotransferase [Clostridia bacterium]
MRKENAVLNLSHYLLLCRLDNWLRLLWRNRFAIEPKRLPQALLITLLSLLLSPFALIEALILHIPLRRGGVKKAPVYIVGHWRSGTTLLQNILTRDPQFGFADPIGTLAVSNSFLLGFLLKRPMQKPLLEARPMDNMRYSLDLPIEEVFGLATISPYAIIHCVSFPKFFPKYLSSVFVCDMTAREKRSWQRSYRYLLDKLSLRHGGRRLLLKSPDNTGHISELLELYPDARFISIHREPYVTLRSTLNMFQKQIELMRLSRMPDIDYEEELENHFIWIFERMYRMLFELEKRLPKNRFADISYEDFTAEPELCLRRVYDALELEGFEAALPRMRAYIETQKGYVKNQFSLSERLKRKINERLGFYFEHYGYEMEQ